MKDQNPVSRLLPAPTLCLSGWGLLRAVPALPHPAQSPGQQLVASCLLGWAAAVPACLILPWGVLMALFSDALWVGGEDQLPKALILEPFPAPSQQLLWLFRPE